MELPSPLAALPALLLPCLLHAVLRSCGKAEWSAQQSWEFCGPMSGRPKASRAGALPWPKIICQEGPARKKVWRQFAPAPHSLSHECHLQEAKEQDTSKKKSPRRDDSQVITHYQTTTYCCARAWRNLIAALVNNSAASTSFAAAWARSTSKKPRR